LLLEDSRHPQRSLESPACVLRSQRPAQQALRPQQKRL
jgi:hypothetical protein